MRGNPADQTTTPMSKHFTLAGRNNSLSARRDLGRGSHLLGLAVGDWKATTRDVGLDIIRTATQVEAKMIQMMSMHTVLTFEIQLGTYMQLNSGRKDTLADGVTFTKMCRL